VRRRQRVVLRRLLRQVRKFNDSLLLLRCTGVLCDCYTVLVYCIIVCTLYWCFYMTVKQYWLLHSTGVLYNCYTVYCCTMLFSASRHRRCCDGREVSRGQ
jgi:hypothetical protein